MKKLEYLSDQEIDILYYALLANIKTRARVNSLRDLTDEDKYSFKESLNLLEDLANLSTISPSIINNA
tara:strand:+ start:184 stop:387 length:204 start_codon:yes stop_codon:yes gene_type:complete